MKHFQTTSKEIIEPKHFHICLFLHLFSGVEVFHPFCNSEISDSAVLYSVYCIQYTTYSVYNASYCNFVLGF